MKKVLESLCEGNKLVSIYCDESEFENFMVGKILAVYSQHVLIENYSPEGKYDGISCFPIKDIIKFDRSSLYLEQIKKLKEENYKKENSNFVGKDIITEILVYLQMKKNPAEFYLSWGERIEGYVQSILNEEYLICDVADSYGNIESETLFSIQDIRILSYGTVQLSSYLKN